MYSNVFIYDKYTILYQTEINNFCINDVFHEYNLSYTTDFQSRGTNFWDTLYIYMLMR